MKTFRNQHTTGAAGNDKWNSEERMPWPDEYFKVSPMRMRSTLSPEGSPDMSTKPPRLSIARHKTYKAYSD